MTVTERGYATEGARPLQDGSGILPGRDGSDVRRGLDCAVAEAVRAVSRRDTGAGIRKENRYMPENEAKAVPATNDTSSFEPLTGPAAGPPAVSEANPRYFAIAADDVADQRAVYLTGS